MNNKVKAVIQDVLESKTKDELIQIILKVLERKQDEMEKELFEKEIN